MDARLVLAAQLRWFRVTYPPSLQRAYDCWMNLARCRSAGPQRPQVVLVSVLCLLAPRADANQPERTDAWVEGCLKKVRWNDPPSTFDECARQAVAEGRLGDVLVHFDTNSEQVQILATKSLGRKYEQCVRRVLERSSCLLHPPRSAASVSWINTYDLHFGAVRPLLPPEETLIDAWNGLLAADWPWTRTWARRKLKNLLPPDVLVTDDRCLWHPMTTALNDAGLLWLQRTGREVPELWKEELEATLAGGAPRDAWVALRGGQFLSVKQFPLYERVDRIDLPALVAPRGSRSGRTLCLHHGLDSSAESRIRRRMDEVGQGWVGDFYETLTLPRVALPADRRYVDVAPVDTGVCAIDMSGAVVCAGKRPLGAGLTGPFVEIDGAAGRVCVRTAAGVVSCKAPAGQTEPVPPGQYSSLSMAFSHTCAIKADRTISCWTSTASPEPVPTGHFSRLSSAGGRCAVRDDGHILCWAPTGRPSGDVRVRDYGGGFKYVDGSEAAGCGIGDDGLAKCWIWDVEPTAVPTRERFREISTPEAGRWCGITERGGVICGDKDRVDASQARAGDFHGLVSRSSASCALDRDGRASCWGWSWPHAGGARRFQTGQPREGR